MTTLLDTIRSTMTRHKMFRRGERVLAAVSAGPDSTALLGLLVALAPEWKLRLRAVYINHGLRPAAARREAERVQELGRRWGVPVSVIRRVVRLRRGESPESAARRVRYEALTSVARQYNCRTVALGHTQDDQAETVLLWILRGVGFTGLAGIPPARQEGGIRFVRPLLAVSRCEVEQFLKGQGIRPLLDRSNLSNRYRRNRLRNRLIPQLEREYNPQLRRHLAALAALVREELEWIDRETASQFRSMARVRRRTIRLDRSQLQKAHPALRRELFRLSVRRLRGDSNGFTERHWRLLEQLAANGSRGALDLPHQLRAEVRTNFRRRLRIAQEELHAGETESLKAFARRRGLR